MHEYVASLIGISKDLCSHIDPRDEVIKRFLNAIQLTQISRKYAWQR